MTAVVLEHVSRTFGPVTAVDDASLRVDAGEVVGLVGPNGAGKTTLIRVLLGLLRPDRGTVELAGGPPSRETRRRVGYVPQSLGLWTDLTLAEHLALVGDVYGSPYARIAEEGLVAASRDMAFRVSGSRRGRRITDQALVAAADRLVGDLPLGLRRRAAFAVALSHQPDVLVLDEPTSGVDALARSQLWDEIHAAAEDGAAVLVSTHYLEEAARCDRIVLLAGGRVAAAGTAEELTADRTAVQITAPRWQEAWQRLDDAGLGVLPAGRSLRVAGATPEEVRRALGDVDAEVAVVPATLDEVFLQAAAA